MVLDNIAKDFPSQFQDQQTINDLCFAFDRQLKEIESVFASLRSDRAIDKAVGKQLDLIGDIVGLTRADGALLCGREIHFDVLDDDRYRLYLKYKAYKNANSCTYEDVVNQLTTILGENKFSYSEDMVNNPATILLTVNLNNDGSVSLVNIPTVSPAGVNVLYSNKIEATISVDSEISVVARTPSMYCGTFSCGTRPQNVSLGG